MSAKKTAVHICSLSDSTIVYKAMCAGRLLAEFYPDLADPGYETAFAIFHQRYATNSLPAWHRAQPLRMLAHNGEINTVWGNRARMAARDSTLPAECKPLFTPDGTDSTSLDEAVELIARNGRTVAEAVRMLLPPARARAGLRVPALPRRLRRAVGRPRCHRLRRRPPGRRRARPQRPSPLPLRHHQDGLVVAGSEAGLVDLDPERVHEQRPSRSGPDAGRRPEEHGC